MDTTKSCTGIFRSLDFAQGKANIPSITAPFHMTAKNGVCFKCKTNSHFLWKNETTFENV